MTGVYSMEEAVEAINSGLAQRFLFKPWRPEQLVALVRQAARTFLLERSHENLLDELRKLNLELEERVADRTRELEHTNRQLEQRNTMLQKMALTDALTGLPNRRAMDRLAKTEVLRRARTPSPLAVALVDADNFKSINTRFLLAGRRPRPGLARADAGQRGSDDRHGRPRRRRGVHGRRPGDRPRGGR